MKRRCTYLIILLALILSMPQDGYAQKKEWKWNHSDIGKRAAKTIPFLDEVFLLADKCSGKKWHYESEFYFRGNIELKKRSLALRFVPNRRFFEHGGRRLMTEGCGVQHYVYPYTFSRHIDATYGSEPKVSMMGDEILDFNCLSIYNEYMITDHLLSPLQRCNAKCYSYRVDSVSGPLIHFSFTARRRNTQLVSGRFVYDVSRQCLQTMVFSGEYGFLTFTMTLEMGDKGKERYWPKKSIMDFKYRYLGNVFEGRCSFTQKYGVLEDDYRFKPERKDRHDVSDQYLVRIDTTRLVVDSMLVAKRRMEPLAATDEAYYSEAVQRRADAEHGRKERMAADTAQGKRVTPWYKIAGAVGEMLVKRHIFETSPKSYFRISSPHISYSGWKGVSYRHDFSYHYTTDAERTFALKATGGYNFRPEQFVWRVSSNFVYSPLNDGVVSFKIENSGIRMSSEGLVKRMMPKSVAYYEGEEEDAASEDIVFDDVELLLEHSIEPVSGLKLLVGGVFHDRSPKGFSRERLAELGIKNSYKSFAPRVNVAFTPCQTYYRKNNKRVVVGSEWPTLCLDWEKGISDTFDSDSKYEKWEFTITKDWTLDALHKIMAKVGGGMFTHRENVDFVEYRYFYDGIIDYNWNDDVSGVFQLLGGKYYNDAYRYLRGHFAYETPTLLLRNVSTRYLRSERFYLNALMTPQLMPYLEIGYGISSHIADLSGFASIERGRFRKAGVKFTLHLFD